MNREELQEIRRKYDGQREQATKAPCSIAAEFLQKIEEVLFTPLAVGATRRQIAQAKYMLQEEYHTWRKSMPAHTTGVLSKHRCLADVYTEAYDRLHLLELSLRPTMPIILDYEEHVAAVRTAPAELPPPPLQIAGIFLGNEEA